MDVPLPTATTSETAECRIVGVIVLPVTISRTRALYAPPVAPLWPNIVPSICAPRSAAPKPSVRLK